MKLKLTIVLFLLPSILLAQNEETYSLEDCYRIAEENYPLNKSIELNTQITAQKLENLKIIYRPKLSFDAKVTYQSTAMEVDLSALPFPPGTPLPEFEAPLYNMALDLNIQQTLWDGGYSKQQKIIEQNEQNVQNKSIEVEVYKVKEQIPESFFLIQTLKKQSKIIELSLKTLNEQLKTVEAAYKNGVSTQTNVLQLKAEIIKLEQKNVQIQAGIKIAYDILFHLMGIDETEQKKIESTEISYSTSGNFSRKENELFELQRTKLDAYSGLLNVTKMPKIGAFARVGYGNPGLNFLSGQWNAYYIVGASLSWNFWDWNESKRKKQIMIIQKELISNQEQTFNKNINTAVKKYENEIEKLDKLIEKDIELIEMNERIVKNYNSRLKNGTITSSSYLTEFNKLLISKLNKEIHEIELQKTKAKLNLMIND